jgi:hypothetical protein
MTNQDYNRTRLISKAVQTHEAMDTRGLTVIADAGRLNREERFLCH